MAATPSPLPIPQQAEPVNPLAQSLTALSRAVPNIDPELAAGIAQGTQSPGEAVNAGQAAQGYIAAVNTKQYLEQQNATNQLSYYKQLTGPEQKMVNAAGYKPPHPGRSLWGQITGDISTAGNDVLNAAGAPLRAAQHVERSAFAIINHPNDPMGGSWDYQRFLSPAEWAHAWNQTSNGEHYILPQVQRRVRDKYGDQVYNLAMKIATGGSATQIVQSAPAAQQQQIAQQIMGDPKFHQALQELNAGHVSEGRVLAYRVFGAKAGSNVGNLLSGATDATLDWFGDPVVIGTKAAKVAGVVRYLVQDGNDVQRIYQSNANVQRAFGKIADHVSNGNYVQLFQDFPKLSPMADVIRQWHPTTAGEVADMFADHTNVKAIISGLPASIPGIVEGGVLPNLSRAGEWRLGAKGILQQAIDFAADRPASLEGLQPGDTIDHAINALGTGAGNRLLTASGQFVRKLTTLTPTGGEFNANDPNWFNKLRDLAMTALPRARANELLNRYAAEATIGGRRNIYAGLLKEVMAAMGIDHIPGVSEWADAVTNPDSAESIISRQMYAPNGIDNVTREGNLTRDGILKSDLTDIWKMPNFKDLYTQSKKLGIMRAVNGSLNNQMVDKFMNEAWKPLALARFGFSVRVAGEEAFGLLLRANPTSYLRARAAGSMLRQEALANDPELQGHLASTWGYLTAHLPGEALKRIATPTDLVVEHLGDATSRAMAKVSGALAGEKYRNAVRLMAEQGILSPDGAFGRYVSASEEHGGNFYDQAINELRGRVWNHGKMVSVRLAKTGAFTDYEPTATLYTNAWYKRLHAVANDPWARVAMELRHDPAADRLQGVADALKQDNAWSRARRSVVTTDGRYVGEDATVDKAARDHAQAIINLVDALTRHPNGEIPGLVDHLLDNHKPPSAAALDKIPEEERPPHVSGPEYLPMDSAATGMFNNGVNRMFSIIGKQIDWISRQPMFIHNFAASMEAYQPMVETWRAMGLSDNDVQRNLVTAVTDRAIKMTTPFIHNPELRSQIEVIGRNIAPFMFAQEQFYKRWARTAVFSPWAFRQAQLINQGVYHSGFTHTDPATGQQYFVYPGASVVQDVIAKSLGAFGYKAFLPIEANLRGQVKMATPGLERVGLPNLGPAVVVPLHFLSGIFPELKGPAQAVEGQQTASQSYISSLVPATVTRVWQDFTATPNNSPQYASAMMQAIQYLEASGHGIGTVAMNDLGSYNGIGAPPENQQFKPGDYMTDRAGTKWVVQADGVWRRNDPAALTAYMQRVKNWTRVFLITRTLFGFSAPASPENLFDPNHVNEDLQALMKQLPFNEAMATFMKLHPDASAYTVFQTKNEAGGYLPATASAMQFMAANQGFFNDHKLAGAFFIPTQDQSGKFDQQAYQNQLQEQLRVRKTPQEFWQEIAYNNAAKTYYNAENAKNQLLSSGGNYKQIDAAWTDQSQQFMAANPLFAQQLADSGSQYKRADIETDLGAALNDPRLPDTPQAEDIRTLFNGWVQYQAMVAPYSAPGGGTLSSQQRYQLEVAFATQALGFIQQHPDAQPVFDRLMRPDLSAALNQMGSTL